MIRCDNGQTVFEGCTNLNEVTIDCDKAKKNFFSGIPSITTVVLTDKVTSIDDYAFSKCSGITSVTIPNSVISIGDCAFRECGSLASVTIGNNVTSIGEDAFYNCTNMTSLTLGNSIKTIKKWAFSYCKNLTSILVLCVPERLEDDIFYSSNINEVTFDCEKVVSLFRNTNVKKIAMTDKVTTIGWNAFTECYDLTSVTIPNSVEEIGFYAFQGCKKITSLIIGNGVKGLGQFSFASCTNLTSITIPGNVNTIGNSAFEGCTSLSSVIINDGVSFIGSKAFSGCRKLSSSVSFPSSITNIDGKAFESVPLDTIIVASQNPPSIIEKSDAWSTFDTWHFPSYLYVPSGCVEKYKIARGWKDFYYIKENPNETSIQKIISGNETNNIYSLNGEKQKTPSKGINIIRHKDGTTKKVLIK